MPDTELSVEFDQPQEVFLPGYPISGRVLLATESKYKARAVNIQFVGHAYTNWEDYESVRRTNAEGNSELARRRVHYSATVNYLENEILLWACRDGSNEIPAGQYIWPFSFTLPFNVPPSFEGKYGYVRYSVTAEVDRPWRFDKAKKRCITVSPLVDLNTIPQALAPLQDQASENIGCCCFKKGFLELRVDIPKSGFVPGEIVPVNLHILNHGSVPVNEAKLKIIQHCKFYAYRDGFSCLYTTDSLLGAPHQDIKTDSADVVKLTQLVDVQPGQEHRMSLEARLPSVTPTINQFCPIIHVEYMAEISIETTSTFNSSVECETPILIGTVPIRQYLPPAYYPQNPSLPPSQPVPLPPQPGFVEIGSGDGHEAVRQSAPPYPVVINGVVPSAPPMTYEDSMYGKEGTQVNTDEQERPFVPKYPVFDLPIYNPSAPPKE